MPYYVQSQFPNAITIIKTSEATQTYNCIAWAFEDDTKCWWPEVHPDSYWPLDFTGITSRQAFLELFQHFGWEETPNREVETGYKKIALYTNNSGTPRHAARLLDSGLWTSKIGKHIDISHTESCLSGQIYGEIEKIFKKAR